MVVVGLLPTGSPLTLHEPYTNKQSDLPKSREGGEGPPPTGSDSSSAERLAPLVQIVGRQRADNWAI